MKPEKRSLELTGDKPLQLQKIEQKTRMVAAAHVGGLMEKYKAKINQVYLKERSLKLTFTVEIAPDDSGVPIITTNINFITERVKDKRFSSADEDQGELFKWLPVDRI